MAAVSPEAVRMAAALRAVVAAVLDSIRTAGPLGAPEGVIFAALQTQGCTLRQFQSLIDALVKAGKVRRSGHLLFSVEG